MPELPSEKESISRLVAAIGILLLALCVIAVIRRQDVLAGGLAVLGLGAIVLAVLAPRLTGPVEMGPTGFKLQLVQRVSATGKVAGYSESELLDAIRDVLADKHTPAPTPPKTTTASRSSDTGDRAETERLPHADASDKRIRAGDETQRAGLEQANLAQALLVRYQRTGAPDDFNDALEQAEKARAMTNPDSFVFAHVLLLCARVWLERYRLSGELAALDRTVAMAQEALDSTSTDSLEYADALEVLASTLQERFQATGEIASQDQAIDVLRVLEEARRSRGA